MARPIFVTGIVVASLSAPPAALAQVTDAGAEEIRTEVTAAIESIIGSTPGGLAVTGPVTVAAAGDHYRLAIPGFEIPHASGTLAGLEATVAPLANGWLAVTPTIGDPPILASWATNAGPRTLTAAGQSGSLTYAPAYRSVMAADLALSGIALKAPTPGRFEIGRLGIDVSSTPGGGDRYDQSIRLDVRDGAFVGSGGDATLGRLEAGLSLRAFDFAAYAELEAAASARLAAAPESAGAPADLLSEMWALALSRPSLFDGVRFELSMDALDAWPSSGIHLTVDQFSAGLSVEGARADALTLGLRAAWRNYAASPEPAKGAEFLPRDLLLDLSLRSIPSAGVAAMLRRWNEEFAGMDLGDVASAASGEFLLAILLQDHVVLDVAMTWQARAGTFGIEGSFHPAPPGSAILVVGTAHVTIGRIDDAIAAIGADPSGARLLQALTMLKLLGTDATDAQGRAIEEFEVEIRPDGAVMVNGTDLAPVLGPL